MQLSADRDRLRPALLHLPFNATRPVGVPQMFLQRKKKKKHFQGYFGTKFCGAMWRQPSWATSPPLWPLAIHRGLFGAEGSFFSSLGLGVLRMGVAKATSSLCRWATAAAVREGGAVLGPAVALAA